MRKSLTLTLTIVALSFAVLFGATTAQAQSVSVSGPVTVSDTLGNIGFDLDQFIVTLNSDSSDAITAFDLSVTGTLAQAQDFTFGAHVESPQAADVSGFPAAVQAQDSHILLDLILPGPPIDPPSEGLITPGVGGPGSGFGQNLLSSQVAIAGPSQAASVDAFQIVLEPGTFATLTGTIAISGNPDPVDIGSVCIGSTAACNVDPNMGQNTPPSVDDLFAGDPNFDQRTLATFTTPASYQLQGTDAEDGDDDNLGWVLDSFSGPFSGAGVALPGASNGNETVSSTGLFEWDPTGSPKGFYFANVTVTDSGGLSDSGVLLVQVPEPSTVLLAGLSLVGVFARRRNS